MVDNNGRPGDLSRKMVSHADWISLRDYLDKMLEMNNRAIDKAENTMNERLARMNEFRDSLKDQAAQFVTRDQIKAELGPLLIDVRELRSLADIARGKATQKSVMIVAAVSAAGLIFSLLDFIIKFMK